MSKLTLHYSMFISAVVISLVLILGNSSSLCSAALQRGGKNVCVKSRLVKPLDIYASGWKDSWDCLSYYPEVTCNGIRSGEIDINQVFFIEEELSCCAGWTITDEEMTEVEEECGKVCEDGYYGENCKFECRCLNAHNPGSCDAVNGDCDCLDGWKGLECSARCKADTYGPGCTRFGVPCENGGINHPVSGTCLCRDGYHGSNCGIQCELWPQEPLNCGVLNCQNCVRANVDVCDHQISACLCKDGWSGRYCTDLCMSGSTGPGCGGVCCSGNGYCLATMPNQCLCDDGYYGDQCNRKCEGGTSGRNCLNRCQCPSCNHVTGECSSCPAGYTGLNCMETCTSNSWGVSCSEDCSCDGHVCDVIGGLCPQNALSYLPYYIAFGILVVVVLLIHCGLYYCWVTKKRKVLERENPNMTENKDDATIKPQHNSSEQQASAGYEGPTVNYYSTVSNNVHAESNQRQTPTGQHHANPIYGIDTPDTEDARSQQTSTSSVDDDYHKIT